MAGNKRKQMPVKGGVRRKRVTAPRLGTDGTMIEYNCLSNLLATDAVGIGLESRFYIPGLATGLVNSIGPDLVGYYSTGKFEPGTKIRWEPTVSFTTSGRVYVGFTDNPEVATAIFGVTGSARVNAIRALGNTISFPVWQETEINFPTATRRKRFDTNEVAVLTAVDVLDRSCQMVMFAACEGTASTPMGQFWFHDKVSVEGIHGTFT
jgi:hypothetical protein